MHLHLRSLVAKRGHRRPVLLIHGAANSARVWVYWQQQLADAGWTSHALDLRGHGESAPVELDTIGMDDYLDDVRTAVRALPARPIVVGWGMGGLVALRAAEVGLADACIALAPSAPALERDRGVPIRSGVFDASEYGITSDDPRDQPEMPDLDIEERRIALASRSLESLRARDERKAGVVIASCAVPVLLVTGGQDRSWGADKYVRLHLDAERVDVPGASHWGLVLSRAAVEQAKTSVLSWLARHARMWEVE